MSNLTRGEFGTKVIWKSSGLPISLERLQSNLRHECGDDEQRVRSMLEIAIDEVEKITRRSIRLQVREFAIDDFPCEPFIELDSCPVWTLEDFTQFKDSADDGSWQAKMVTEIESKFTTVAPIEIRYFEDCDCPDDDSCLQLDVDFRLDCYSKPARVYGTGYCFHCWPNLCCCDCGSPNRVRVRYLAGYLEDCRLYADDARLGHVIIQIASQLYDSPEMEMGRVDTHGRSVVEEALKSCQFRW